MVTEERMNARTKELNNSSSESLRPRAKSGSRKIFDFLGDKSRGKQSHGIMRLLRNKVPRKDSSGFLVLPFFSF
ncbi:MAG: hypothetical protein A3K06_03260 [Candidatus Doudnabacteria bacterium RIFCSPHIGHO2_01_52_17]|uniref:Uncharacterized protein n=1 Tax=Candidatus Doudnabacteria bacterium RIFCSPHIGHO2_01_52_17 TaxID=1817820 RepID=A0A1F5N8E6_9BACT|nr:MAG: hypothetical protein A3K06_03260 [Candidatus Doudnabacteria bacterium RIFCSPHIGHO2_01_52_17]